MFQMLTEVLSMVSKDEIKRANMAHKRADEAVAMLGQGVVLGTVTVLFADENNGVEAKWTLQEVEQWPEVKERLVYGLAHFKRLFGAKCVRTLIGLFGQCRWSMSDGAEPIGYYQDELVNGRVMYPENEAYLTKYPPADPYAQHRKAHQDGRE